MADNDLLLYAHIATSSFLLGEDNPQSIQQKLTDAFASLKVYWFRGLIQFWAAETIDGRCLLTTSDQPFIINKDDKNWLNCKEYRSCCEKYKYNIDKVQVEKDPTIISTGAPATAFRNQLPEFHKLPSDMIVEEMSPMASSALECGFMFSFVVPVFYPSLSSCVGVVEYSGWFSYLLEVLKELNTALEKVGFKTFDGRERLPYKTICDLQYAKDEIDDALRIISEALRLDLTQVWIAYEDEYHVAFSSSLQDTQTKRMLWLKLTGHCFQLYEDERNMDMEYYEEACYSVPMKMDQVFAGKTLQNYELLFIQNIKKLNGDEPQRLLSFSIECECSCFMIHLRSTKTGELDYVFEFFLSKSPHSDNMFELLLFLLKRRLPSFKFASGAELGDELCVLDAQASTESETKYIKIFQTNQLSPVSITQKRGRRPHDEECSMPLKAKCKTAKKEISREQIELQFGKTQKKAAENLKMSLSTLKRYCKVLDISEWPGKDYLKKNVNHLYKNTQSNSNEEEEEEDNGGAIQDNIRETSLGENILTIKAEYADHDSFKFHLPISSATFEAIQKEINERFNLSPSDYKVKYLDEEGDWISLSSEKDMRVCIHNLRDSNITKIKMQVVILGKI